MQCKKHSRLQYSPDNDGNSIIDSPRTDSENLDEETTQETNESGTSQGGKKNYSKLKTEQIAQCKLYIENPKSSQLTLITANNFFVISIGL